MTDPERKEVEIKPCPFCGGGATLKQYAIKQVSAYCLVCKTETIMTDRDTAIMMWNLRTKEKT